MDIYYPKDIAVSHGKVRPSGGLWAGPWLWGLDGGWIGLRRVRMRIRVRADAVRHGDLAVGSHGTHITRPHPQTFAQVHELLGSEVRARACLVCVCVETDDRPTHAIYPTRTRRRR